MALLIFIYSFILVFHKADEEKQAHVNVPSTLFKINELLSL